jgi:hypothetical protein
MLTQIMGSGQRWKVRDRGSEATTKREPPVAVKLRASFIFVEIAA